MCPLWGGFLNGKYVFYCLQLLFEGFSFIEQVMDDLLDVVISTAISKLSGQNITDEFHRIVMESLHSTTAVGNHRCITNEMSD